MNEKAELSGSLKRIKSLYNQLTPSEQQVADYIFTNLRDFHRLTISEVAEKCQVSVATLTRFAKSCGYSGFPELRTSLIPDILDWQKHRYHSVALEEVTPTDPISTVIRKFDIRIKEACSLALSTIDPEQLEQAVHAILKAKRIVLIGNGGSVYLAASTALKFLKLGLTAISYLDYNGIQAAALMLQEGDVALAVSHRGTTRETLDSLSLAVGTGCTTIVCTGWGKSPMAKISDIQLVYGVVQEESEIGLARVVQALILDLLATTVALKINGQKKK